MGPRLPEARAGNEARHPAGWLQLERLAEQNRHHGGRSSAGPAWDFGGAAYNWLELSPGPPDCARRRGLDSESY